ncbi:hypothetical protein [Desulforhopalus singaporensis]|uniref:Uncharacterized protein n=1 Tax=Desulforhopalus singaporensis TaxID=91360 RepID=A0A1H0QP95_9BACT|nr:hypothetical protein [Desulforhopalus singaporensis]SDP19072.1 hypothetical protein SAMN05660330_02056 [Desulforhopalus singaporensis]
MEHKDLWDLESAMKVLSHPTVDSKLWAEAVEWLIVNGPPEIKKMLLKASAAATASSFPDLKPVDFTPDGEPVYDIKALARELNISEEEVQKILAEKKAMLDINEFFDNTDNGTTH